MRAALSVSAAGGADSSPGGSQGLRGSFERRLVVTEVLDDPIIRCMERTGYPPWYRRKQAQSEDERADEDARGEDDDGSF